MSTRTIQAVLYPVGAPACRVELESDETGSFLGALQDRVGGLIDVFSVAEGSPDLIVNDEGLYTQIPNRAVYATRDMEEAGYLSQIDGSPVKAGDPYAILFGPIVAVGCDEEGGTVGVDDAQISFLKESGHLGGPASGLAELSRILSAARAE